MRKSNYIISINTKEFIFVVDVGPWNEFMTVTNNVEDVLKSLGPVLGNKKLYYEDSEGIFDEILHDGIVFMGFSPADRKDVLGSYARKVLARKTTPRNRNAFLNSFRKTNPSWRH